MNNRVVAGLVIGLLGAGTLVAAGVAGAADAESVDAPSSGVAAPGKLIADINSYDASLTDGRALNVTHGAEHDLIKESASGLLRGAFQIDNTEAKRDIDGSAAYQIRVHGDDTGYWLVARMHWDPDEETANAECTIYQGEPGHGGKVSTDLLTCTTQGMDDDDSGNTERFVFALAHAR